MPIRLRHAPQHEGRSHSIADDIDRMPMGNESLMGDMGSSLSGGQRQRVLIARALYRQPRFTFADEVAASLDPANHARICGHPDHRDPPGI